MQQNRFFYILGNPRSGTSLFRLILNAHPSIVAPPECGFIQWLFKDFKDADLSDPGTRSRFADAVLASKKMETWEMEKDDVLNALNASESFSYSAMCQAVFTAYANQKGKSTIKAIVDKNNYYIDHLETIDKAMPEAYYLFIVRDVRDVICSYKEIEQKKFQGDYAPKLPTDAEEIAASWRDKNENIKDFLKDKDHFVVRYEDIVSNLKGSIREVLDFMGLPFDELVLDYYKVNDEPQQTLAWKKKTLDPLDSTRIERYRSVLSDKDIATAWNTASETLKSFGYEK